MDSFRIVYTCTHEEAHFMPYNTFISFVCQCLPLSCAVSQGVVFIRIQTMRIIRSVNANVLY